jgi:hypothetical protein
MNLVKCGILGRHHFWHQRTTACLHASNEHAWHQSQRSPLSLTMCVCDELASQMTATLLRRKLWLIVARSAPAMCSAHATCTCEQVALLFLADGELPHEAAWRSWLQSAEGLLPTAQISQV